MNINLILIVIVLLLYLIFLLVGRIFLNKFSSLEQIFIRNNRRLSSILELMKGSFDGTVESLRSFNILKQTLLLEQKQVIFNNPKVQKIITDESRNLGSRSDIRRKEASVYLGMIGSEQVRPVLEQALAHEQDASVRMYISNALTDIRDPRSLPVMLDALPGSHRWYRTRAISNLLEFGAELQPHFTRLSLTMRVEWIEFLVKYAIQNFNEDTRQYLFHFVDDFEQIKQASMSEAQHIVDPRNYRAEYVSRDLDELLVLACRALSDLYFTAFGQPKYYNHANPVIARNGLWAVQRSNSAEGFQLLLARIRDERFSSFITGLLRRMLEVNPRYMQLVETAFSKSTLAEEKKLLAQVIAGRVEYYVLQLNGAQAQKAGELISYVLQSGRANELIGFINLNRSMDENLQRRLEELIRKNVQPESALGVEMRTYLYADFVHACGMEPILTEKKRRAALKDRDLAKAVTITFVLGFLLVPILFLLRYAQHLEFRAWASLISRYVIDFNYGLIYYTLSLAFITIGLMLASYVNVKRQSRLWNLKNISLLFRSEMIPSISIIAPAYNEEKTIVSSVRSLLNLKYPDYELIVVNDGSSDSTLRRLIDTFGLVRSEYLITPGLATSPILGIYRDPSHPNFIVVDKVNGGKADSLNTGINVANKSYICCIDSDSVLEPESLLKLASLTLDRSVETPALGGNILPINSCKVENGQIVQKKAPDNWLARLQTIEYIRAFMIGRLGWQQLGSLLIISGAFGLFRKDRVIGVGGYLTNHTRYHKDTVGEDMELVVRISRHMRQMKQPFEIAYAFNANCWTEVPEDLRSLKNQRYRWQRGLVDILYYHKQMLFNGRYGQVGILAMPYFLVFETLGPLFEIQGYALIILASILGLLDVPTALLLFISSVLLGVVNSLVALLIAEHEEQIYTTQDLIRLVILAVAENFGPRQWVSLWRVLGEFNIIFGAGGWGTLQRKGIEKAL